MRLTIPIPETQEAIRVPAGMLRLNDDEFFQFCQTNRDLHIERSPNGEIIVMSPAGGYASFQSLKVATQLDTWATRDGSGVAFDSSAGFRLPNGAIRSPDAAWVSLARLKQLSHREKERFLPLCPDFVIEVASPSDDISELREKMKEYVSCGLRMGWLILPATTQAEIYTPDRIETLNSPATIGAGPVLPGFKLELLSVWNPPF
ncbi:MAG: Uma2 family endonuclease [Terriglobia bacterium]